MNLKALEVLAKSIKSKGKIVTVDNLITESLFHKFGTLNEEQAQNLLWAKREQIATQMDKEGYKTNSFICPMSLEFIAWQGEKMPWDNN